MKVGLAEVASIVEGVTSSERSGDVVTGVTVNSRLVSPGDLFVAFIGGTLDGHDFVDEALKRGAAAAMVSREVDSAGPVIQVADTGVALTKLARWVRDSLDPLVVGITGSTGKTSTKDLVVAVSSTNLNTLGSEKNYNNEIGVPLTLLGIKAETEVVVCEMGARGIGHIAALCELARPQVGIVTNVGVTHYEQFGSVEAIARAKSELVRSLPEGGTAVLNADDPAVLAMRDSTAAEVITFGLGAAADVRGEQVTLDGLGRPSFRIAHGAGSIWVTLPFSGRHHCPNALAAVAAGLALGIPIEDMRTGLERAVASPWRMQVERSEGVLLVNDAYNASPSSVEAALETCTAMVAAPGRLIAILGHMAELGDIETAEHWRIGEIAAQTCSRLIVVGTKAKEIAEGARAAGMTDVIRVGSPDEVTEHLSDLGTGDVVLVKGSRSAGLENVTESLKGVPSR